MTASDHHYREAIAHLRHLIDQAYSMGERDPTAASLATADAQARPSVRIIAVARTEESGLLFFASSSSGKGQQMQANPRAALCFYWPGMQEQAVVEGKVVLLDTEASDRYWAKRPREAQLGAWMSEKGNSKAEGEAVKERLRGYKQEFDQQRVPRPDAWRAYRLEPDRIGFWPSGWHRLRAQVDYRRDESGNWQRHRHQP
jgi:pyridoxamine 5'-phosphate oxidase